MLAIHSSLYTKQREVETSMRCPCIKLVVPLTLYTTNYIFPMISPLLPQGTSVSNPCSFRNIKNNFSSFRCGTDNSWWSCQFISEMGLWWSYVSSHEKSCYFWYYYVLFLPMWQVSSLLRTLNLVYSAGFFFEFFSCYCFCFLCPFGFPVISHP